MNEFAHPRVVVGVDGSLTGLAALRTAVVEARRRGVPLHAVRARAVGQPLADRGTILTTFLDALGVIPSDLEIHLTVSMLCVTDALRHSASDPRDLIIVGSGGKGAFRALWSGSVSRSLLRGAVCPILAVPAPEMAHAARRSLRWSRLSRQDLWERIETEVPELRGARRVEERDG